MADTVQVVLEAMAPELEDFRQRGIFSDAEVRAIVQRRRDFEWLFAKVAPVPEDYQRALDYELALESLRLERRGRLGLRRSTLSDHSVLRRVHFVFDRACRRFREEPQWWLQWAAFALRSNSAKAVGRILAQALQLHPRSQELWLQAAEFEFDRQGNVSSARSLLLRALRVNGQAFPLWLAYFRMECLYVQKMRGRRLALGGGSEAAAAAAAAGAQEEEAAAAAAAEEEDDAALDAAAAAATAAPSGGALPGEEHGMASKVANAAGGAQEAFFAGAVPRIVLEHLRATLRLSVQQYSALLGVMDECTDALAVAQVRALGGSAAAPSALAVAAQGAAALGAAGAQLAFPDLTAHLLQCLAEDCAEEPQAWQVMAQRGLARLQAAAGALARRQGRRGGGEEGEGGEAAPSAALPDTQLFQVDTKGERQKLEAEAQQQGSSSSSSSSSSSGGGSRKRKLREAEAAPGAGSAGSVSAFRAWAETELLQQGGGQEGSAAAAGAPSCPLGPALPPQQLSLLAWSYALSTGIVDSVCVGSGALPSDAVGVGLEEGGLAEGALLPPAGEPLWVLLGEGRAGGAGGDAALAVLDSGAAPEPLQEGSALLQLFEWAEAVAANADKVYAAALKAASAASSSSSSSSSAGAGAAPSAAVTAVAAAAAAAAPSLELGLLLAQAQSLAALLRLPLPACPTNTRRCLQLLQRLQDVCAQGLQAAPAAPTASPAAATATLQLALLQLQALLRSGRVAEALALAPSVRARCPVAALPYARLLRLCAVAAPAGAAAQLEKAASSASAGKQKGRAAGDAGSSSSSSSNSPWHLTPASAGPHHALALPPALAALTSAAQACPPAPPAASASSYLGALLGMGSGGAAGSSSSGGAAAALPKALRVHLWPALLQASLEAARSSSGARAGPLAAAAAVLERCARDSLGPQGEAPTRALYLQHLCASASSSGSGALEPRELQLALGGSAAPAHVHCAALAALLRSSRAGRGAAALAPAALRQLFDLSVASHGAASAALWLLYLEFESSVGGARLQPPTNVHARALRALKGQEAVAFVEGAALLGAGIVQ